MHLLSIITTISRPHVLSPDARCMCYRLPLSGLVVKSNLSQKKLRGAAAWHQPLENFKMLQPAVVAGRCSSLVRLGLATPARGLAAPQCTTLNHPADARCRCRPRTSPPTDGVAGADWERETKPFQRARRASAAASGVTRLLFSSDSFSVVYSYFVHLLLPAGISYGLPFPERLCCQIHAENY